MIGRLGIHKRNGLVYVYEFNPDTEKPGWLRYDTFVRGEWRKYPWKTAKNEDVRQVHARGGRRRPR